jgi:hypothetical protein
MFLPLEDRDSEEEDRRTDRRSLLLCVPIYKRTTSKAYREILAHADDHRFCQVNQEFLRHYKAPSTSSHFRIARELSQLAGTTTYL